MVLKRITAQNAIKTERKTKMNFTKSIKKALETSNLSEVEAALALEYARVHPEGFHYEWGCLVQGRPPLVFRGGWSTPQLGFRRKRTNFSEEWISVQSRLAKEFFDV
jgi:hypothetical protein